jgi:8-oxo-dGTP pyrophosphatase MutT (NUDIX family)
VNEPTPLLLAGTGPLLLGDSAAGILILPDGRYLLQERDPDPNLWYGGHYGLFGGSIDPGETAEAALRRELQEELELTVGDAPFFLRADYGASPGIGGVRFRRDYYVVMMTEAQVAGLRLHEGRSMTALTAAQVFSGLPLTPYDGFVLYLHANRTRLRPQYESMARFTGP